jgi:uncharacterized protein YjbI with pentapeptide repeats
MANRDQLNALNTGAEAWNRWLNENSEVKLDFRSADLQNLDLRGKRFPGADFRRAKIKGSDLSDCDFASADLRNADLSSTKICNAYFHRADFSSADLSRALLSDSNLTSANFEETILIGANLERADLGNSILLKAKCTAANLRYAKIRNADLHKTDFEKAILCNAVFNGSRLTNTNLSEADISYADLTSSILQSANLFNTIFRATVFFDTSLYGLDLSKCLDLESANVDGPCPIGLDTLALSHGQLPNNFLRGSGLTEWELEMAKLYRDDLDNESITDIVYKVHGLRADQLIQISPLFISYTHADEEFVNNLEGRLKKKGIRYWRDKRHSTAGRLETQIERAIRLNPTVLLVLSANSVGSDWVEHEARVARELEKELKRDVLCPIALDNEWKTCTWPERLREQIVEYNILDFSGWRKGNSFDEMFSRLIAGLDLYYKEGKAKHDT